MTKSRVLSFILAVIMLISIFPLNISAALQTEKEMRRVYLHAFGEAPLLTNTADRTTVYMGDTVDVSLAVDTPNKADNDEEQQYNLGGFTVKIYFDTRYFDFVPPYINTEEKTKNTAIEYDFVADNGWNDGSIEDGSVGDVENKPAGTFITYSQGTHTKDKQTGTQGYAYATVFYGGKSLPYGADNEEHWYDIARLPLIPKQTGNTRVQVDISGDDAHTLELFAKDNPNVDEIKRSFEYTAENSGVFNITIADRSKPNPPVATPGGSTYTAAQKVKLSIENEYDKPGKIYFTTDGSEPTKDSEEYTAELDASGGIPIEKTTALKCITLREKDGRISNVAVYQYNIVPAAPVLFNENKQQISNSYTEDWVYSENWDEDGYKVYASDKTDFNANIADGSTLYYTFSDLSASLITDEPGNIYVGNDAETQWVVISNDTRELKDAVTKLRTVRLVNCFKEEKSAVSTYYLGVKPGAVNAAPKPEQVSEQPVSITLSCDAPPEAEIYYTLNGENPIAQGTLYEGTVTLTRDTTVKAVSYYEGVWGSICEFNYSFTNNPDQSIIAFNPPGNYEGIVNVSLLPKEPGRKVMYSVDGEQPKEYTGALSLDKDSVITAYVEGDEENVHTFSYKIKPLPPVFAPEETQLTHAEWVTIFTPDCTSGTKDDFELKFTVDGSIPTKNTVNSTGTKYTYNPETHEARVYVTDKTEIKAVVVKHGEYVSDVVSHKYEIISGIPAMPALVLSDGYYSIDEGETLSTVFKDMTGYEIYYTVGNNGYPFPDPDPNNEQHKYTKDTPIEFAANQETVIKAIAVKKGTDGNLIMSDTAVFRYNVSRNSQQASSAAVFADKPSGTYVEGAAPHTVTLSGSNDIWYNKNGEGWKQYTEPIEIEFDRADASLYIRDGENGEPTAYVYHFEPPAPVIMPTPGTYSKKVDVTFDFPEGNGYRYYIQQSGGAGESVFPGDLTQSYTKSVSVEAYVLNINTKVMSKHAYGDYIITNAENLGELYINWPYNQKRISKHLLGTDEYAKGVLFGGTYGSKTIIYQVKYTPNGGSETEYSPEYIYDDKLPVIPTKQMENITIKAWIDGDKQNAIEHTIEFIDLGMPGISVDKAANTNGNYPNGTNARVQNAHSGKANIVVFYTTNGNLPASNQSGRAHFGGTAESNAITLSNTTTIKAVYYSACGGTACTACTEGKPQDCANGIYGEVFSAVYPIVESSAGSTGSGGGGGTKTRKYTKDVFGNEHPTHIGYINGYPDGSVRPDGDITREEIAAILYRITNHEYEKPFVATGEFFPDVEKERWSAHDIEYMTDKNVIYGYPDGEFKPSRNLSRAEFAALVFRFADIKNAAIKNPFTDLEETHWAYNEILALVNSGLAEGYEDSTFRAENNITRAEVMTVINKLLGRKPLESYVKSLEFNPYNDLYEDKWYYVTVLEATITHNYWLNTTGYEYKWEDWK